MGIIRRLSSLKRNMFALNQDMYLAPDCLEKIVMFLDEHPEAASASPRLMKWNFAEKVFTDQIDA